MSNEDKVNIKFRITLWANSQTLYVRLLIGLIKLVWIISLVLVVSALKTFGILVCAKIYHGSNTLNQWQLLVKLVYVGNLIHQELAPHLAVPARPSGHLCSLSVIT